MKRALNSPPAVDKVTGTAFFDRRLNIADRTGLVGLVGGTDTVNLNPGPTPAWFMKTALVGPDQGTHTRVSKIGAVARNDHRTFRVFLGHGSTT